MQSSPSRNPLSTFPAVSESCPLENLKKIRFICEKIAATFDIAFSVAAKKVR